jgi:6-pyruvoyltetrahydropterin/6-carboxytetrahydropterin synthase
VEIELASDALDARGMVRDFNEIKERIQAWIDRELDHKMLLNQDDPALPALRHLGEPVVVMDRNPTAEAIAEMIFAYAASQGFPVTVVKLWETDNSFATYRLDRLPAATGRARSPARGRRRARPAARSISTAA